jgi:multiple sugar transport system substrate-binding protein
MGRGLTRQELLIAGAGAYASLLFAGCGGSGGGSQELAFWNGFTGGDAPTMLAIIDAFKKENPETGVKMVSVRWEDYYQKMPAAVQAGKGPDVGIMHADQISMSAAHRVLRPLDDFAEQLGFQESDFAPDVWRAGVYQGKRYGIPLDMHPLGLFYNKAVLDKAGLEPKAPTDRESFEAALDELKGKGIQGNWVPPFVFTGGFMFQSLLWQFGGDLTNEDGTKATWSSDAGVQAMDYLRGMIKKGYSPNNVAQDADNIAFKNGQSAFIWQGAWGIGDYSSTEGLEWGLAPLPKIGDQPAAWSNSHQFVVPVGLSDRKLEGARDFIDFVTNSPSWAESGMIPARKSARETEAFKKLPAAGLAAEIPYVRFPRPVAGISDVRESTLDIAISEGLSGRKPVRDALDESVTRADELLADNHEKFAAT